VVNVTSYLVIFMRIRQNVYSFTLFNTFRLILIGELLLKITILAEICMKVLYF